MEWISVKDRLPTDSSFKNACKYDYCLVYGEKQNDYATSLYSIAQYRDGKWDILNDVGASSCEGYYDLSSEEVTHWMFLRSPGYKD